eukprot:CAMPEP_0181332220 /NCGR_PEP_ID=MMETSP1101-20121128/24964_1 /TAXON_ID=46948 /ORGANISM="Rhodomonas abbreviata, Strain Caron Lab Isolate" /LENGTH=58 /DNA_ID=CAMNT_0023441823 /DNA_START=508 /DNA_END=684 /DNA_ORIENTATION=-
MTARSEGHMFPNSAGGSFKSGGVCPTHIEARGAAPAASWRGASSGCGDLSRDSDIPQE